MKRSFVCFLTFFLCLIMISTCFSVAEADNEPIETLSSPLLFKAVIQAVSYSIMLPLGRRKLSISLLLWTPRKCLQL